MYDEPNVLLKNDTLDLVASNPTQNVVGCKWVFHIK